MGGGHPDFGFGLWLTLRPEHTQRLAMAIVGLGDAFGGTVFTPHITLRARLGSEAEAAALATTLASAASRFNVRFSRFDAGQVPFEALTLRPDAPTDDLVRLASRAGVDVRTYAPHLSLYYGDADPSALIAAAQARLSLPLDVEVAAVEVWQLVGDVPAWRSCASFALPPPPNR